MAKTPEEVRKYFRIKMREYHKRNPLYGKKYVYALNIQGKKYLFKQQAKAKRVLVSEINIDDYIKCF